MKLNLAMFPSPQPSHSPCPGAGRAEENVLPSWLPGWVIFMLVRMKLALTLCLVSALLIVQWLPGSTVALAQQPEPAASGIPDSAMVETFSSPRAGPPPTAGSEAASSPTAPGSAPPNAAPGASVLMYHHIAPAPQSLAPADAQFFVDPSAFDRQLFTLLANGFNVVTLDRVVGALQAGQPLPAKAVAITVDDGWQDFWQNALPIVNKYAVPVTLFAIANADSHPYMSPNERWALAHSGVDVEAHSLTHPHLTKVLPAQANAEVANSKKALETELGQSVRHFAYPYGDFNAPVLAMVQAAGYEAAFAAGPSSNEDAQHLFQLPRVMVSHYDTLDTFTNKATDYRWARSHATPLPQAPRPTLPLSPPAASPSGPEAATIPADSPPAPEPPMSEPDTPITGVAADQSSAP